MIVLHDECVCQNYRIISNAKEAEEVILDTKERQKIESVIELCRNAKKRLPSNAPFRLKVLLDMTLLELSKDLAQRADDRAA
ncbi:hypothetical protein HCU64_02135 [Methylobacterium sp. C25]|uniref:hypothetical protein n=1 Tax=Methylobacterium sp. C25 TaxID=2721622 RepID=UPI001F3B5FA0|nr:hypothetical protein [Methylobacterium sp. C25]MCE4222539.1 hypothetical protein [Methylobacterium sp. C25]